MASPAGFERLKMSTMDTRENPVASKFNIFSLSWRPQWTTEEPVGGRSRLSEALGLGKGARVVAPVVDTRGPLRHSPW